MFLCGITLVPLIEEVREEDVALVAPFYVDGDAFDGLEHQSTRLLALLME